MNFILYIMDILEFFFKKGSIIFKTLFFCLLENTEEIKNRVC